MYIDDAMTDSNDWLRSQTSTIDLLTLEADAAAHLDPAIHAYIGRGAGDSVAANAGGVEHAADEAPRAAGRHPHLHGHDSPR